MAKNAKVLAISSLAALSLSITACSQYVATPDGENILSFGDGITVTADELLENYTSSQAGVEAYYNAIYDVVARYIMTKDPTISTNGSYQELVDDATVSVEDLKREAETNASTNGTNYDTELETLLDSEGVEDLDELQIKYENENFREYLVDEFYNLFMDNLKVGGNIEINNTTIEVNSYLNDVLPYHVKHILVNVDASANDYARATISSSQATKLSSLVNDLVYLGNDTFGTLAVSYSDDTGSASTYGDLGIMSKNTSFVSEFKLGIYTYDSLFNTSISDSEKNKLELSTAEELENTKDFLSTEGQGISFIPYGVVQSLGQVSDEETDDYGELVNGGNQAYYPRNIIFNKYFNAHQISFITPQVVTAGESAGEATEVVSNITGLERQEDGTYKINGVQTQFRDVEFGQEIGTKAILTDEQGNPIIVTRAGTGSTSSDSEESSGYQGVHFIVVQRSALDPTGNNNTTLEEYYSTEMPDNDGLIDGKVVYVNAFKDDRSTYQSRINALEDEIRAADESIDTKIFQYWFARSGAEIVDSSVKALIDVYCDDEPDQITKQNEYYETWLDYYDLLNTQLNQREQRLIPLVCYTNFGDASNQDGDGELFGKGGICYYVQA